MTTLKPFLILGSCFSMLLAASAHSAIYQCEDEDGRTIFSDQPCESGITKEIEAPESALVSFVSGRITQNDNSFPLRHGIVLKNAETNEITLYLTKHQLTDTQIQMAITGDPAFMDEHKHRGLAEIMLTFKTDKVSIDNLRTMRSSFYGLDKATAKTPVVTNHGGFDVIGHVHTLTLQEENNQQWLSFASQEMTPNIRWNINLVLTLSP